MKHLIEKIVNKEYDSAKDIFESEMSNIVEKKIFEAKKATGAKIVEQTMGQVGPTVPEKRKMDVIEDTIDEKYGKGYESPASKIEKALKKIGKGDIMKSSDKHREEMERLNAQYEKLKAQDKKIDEDVEELDEEELDEARVKIVKARIRGGKVQRRKKVSNVPGMTIRGGKLTRMSPAERRRRRMGQRRGKMKRRAKMTRILMKRQRSIRKRKSLGL